MAFLIKNKSEFKNQTQESGLVYGEMALQDLLSNDTDGDGVLDWEEGLWGTDPTNPFSYDGVADSTYVNKLKISRGVDITNEETLEGEENITQTEQFSRELFATVVALNQAGEVDEETVEKLSDSLLAQVKNTPARKVFSLSEIKITQDNSVQAYQAYSNALNTASARYPMNGDVIKVFEEFWGDGENVNLEALSKLDPITEEVEGFMNEMIKINVPSEISQPHLDIINALERLIENLQDMKFFESDIVITMGGISNYEANVELLGQAIEKIVNTMDQKLNN